MREDINNLEKTGLNSTKMSLYQEKQAQLENIRKECLKGHIVRSRVQYLKESEKPTTFFCQLEKNNYKTKTIKIIQLNNGTIIKYVACVRRGK